MINPKDPAYYSASEGYDPGDKFRGSAHFVIHKPGAMTIELEIASRILANTWPLFVSTASNLNQIISIEERNDVIKDSLVLARKLIEEANK